MMLGEEGRRRGDPIIIEWVYLENGLWEMMGSTVRHMRSSLFQSVFPQNCTVKVRSMDG